MEAKIWLYVRNMRRQFLSIFLALNIEVRKSGASAKRMRASGASGEHVSGFFPVHNDMINTEESLQTQNCLLCIPRNKERKTLFTAFTAP